jgi:hypothetical protein
MCGLVISMKKIGKVLKFSGLLCFFLLCNMSRPERFLEEKNDNLLVAFGLGPRECVGKSLGKQVLDMALPQIFSNFKFTENKPIDMIPEYGLTYTPKHQRINVALVK